jgi:hypothetical protein
MELEDGTITMVWPCKRKDKTKILRRALELKLKGRRPMG